MACLKISNLKLGDRSSELVELDQTMQESICGGILQGLLNILIVSDLTYTKSSSGVDVFNFKYNPNGSVVDQG